MNNAHTQSLRHIALVKIAITLWNQDDIRALTDKLLPLSGSQREGKWHRIEEKVVEKVTQLAVVEHLKDEILRFIKAIGLQILKWIEYHADFLNLASVKKYFNRLLWTPQGTVDKKKTAEVLIKENLDITECYKLACIYCLENDILELWKQLPENSRIYFCVEDPSDTHEHELVFFWTYYINGEVGRIRQQSNWSLYQYAFEQAAIYRNKVATEYFLQKLTSREREESLVKSAKRVAELVPFFDYITDVLCFLLSQMNKEQQITVFKSRPHQVLTCLLDWPWQSLFMETANRVWDFLSERSYALILNAFLYKVDNYKDWDYQELFREFWQQSRHYDHKIFVINISNGFILLNLLVGKDEENIRFILKGLNLVGKKTLIFCDTGRCICQSLVCGDRWNLLKLLIRECISSKNEMMQLKAECKEFVKGRSKEQLAGMKDKLDKFFQLLDDFICEYEESEKNHRRE